jgi:hypothetical protein
MTRSKKSSKKDNNHDALKLRAEQRGFQVIDTYHVGEDFPDMVLTTELAVTIVGTFNAVELIHALAGIEGVETIHPGGVFLCEIKNPDSSHGVTEGQKRFMLQHPMTKLLWSETDVDTLRGIYEFQKS